MKYKKTEGVGEIRVILGGWQLVNRVTAQAVADLLGITRIHFQRIKSGRNKPSAELAKKISNLTGITEMNLLYPEKFR